MLVGPQTNYRLPEIFNLTFYRNMSDKNGSVVLPEVLPKKGVLYFEETSHMVLCKPRIMPLKSITLEKMEQIQKDAQEAVKHQMQFEAETHNSY